MKYTKQEVMQFVEEEDVKFIRLAFCDVFGKQKNISIMPEELNRAFDCGIAIDAWSIEGFGEMFIRICFCGRILQLSPFCPGDRSTDG